MSLSDEFGLKNEYYVIKKYCPAVRSNVVMKVAHDHNHTEYCTNREECQKTGGCQNSYMSRNDIVEM
jgi:superoxide dismutase